MTNKINIARREVRGNLKDLKQIYEINYIEREGNLTDKIEIAIMLERMDGDRYAYRSLRFNSLEEFKQFILDSLKAYRLFMKQRVKYDEPMKLLLISDLNEIKKILQYGEV